MNKNIRRIFTIGETVLDILFKNGVAIHSVAGGSMLNCAVSLARLQCNTFLISEISNDLCGNIILKFLQENEIQTEHLSISNDGQTAISIALLDHNNDAKYEFYRELPKSRLHIKIPNFSSNDIVAFGSFFAISEEVRKPLMQIITAAKNAGALIFYDPNIRKNHCPLRSTAMKMMEENIALADVMRGSNEDFDNLFNKSDIDDVYRQISNIGCKNLFVTYGKDGAWFKNNDFQLHIPSKPIKPVSTVGAGDTFNAGILYGLTKHNIFKTNITELLKNQVVEIIENASEMAGEVCLSSENYIAKR